MKAKVNKLEENSKNKNTWEMYKGINEFKKGYQPHAYVIRESRQNYFGYKIQTTKLQKILVMLGAKL